MSLDSEKWLQVMKSEMQSMYNNQVWNLVDPPEGVKVIGCKWVHKIKHDMTFKSRLVVKGKLMVLTMMRPFHLSLCLSLLGFFLLSLRTMITRFGKWMSNLNGNLLKDVYMTQPEGFVDPKYPNRVCKL